MLKKSIVFFTFFLLTSSCSMHEGIVSGAGWIDNDTYTVSASGANERQAVDNARHQILKDIVEIRVRNKSRYTDIIMIREEFEIPLQNGVIVDSTSTPEGIRITFRIRDKDLKNKFMRE